MAERGDRRQVVMLSSLFAALLALLALVSAFREPPGNREEDEEQDADEGADGEAQAPSEKEDAVAGPRARSGEGGAHEGTMADRAEPATVVLGRLPVRDRRGAMTLLGRELGRATVHCPVSRYVPGSGRISAPPLVDTLVLGGQLQALTSARNGGVVAFVDGEPRFTLHWKGADPAVPVPCEARRLVMETVTVSLLEPDRTPSSEATLLTCTGTEVLEREGGLLTLSVPADVDCTLLARAPGRRSTPHTLHVLAGRPVPLVTLTLDHPVEEAIPEVLVEAGTIPQPATLDPETVQSAVSKLLAREEVPQELRDVLVVVDATTR